ncbi:TfoX/Sxy family protein [Tabrizicola fusiformis]|uniref:TfoX/Sxy family protein n=1 Tax=Tabrizicola sp. SY72 TaxID=2741673 RepID=UPI0015734F83|nr:TfoX/Sxy family protein [Tabrizicola sp. SY72]NTT87864.1 TfoX/Sxy family protein [Tabrizicola sp. SY72]
MAWDEGVAQLLRDDLAAEPVAERRMFGGLAFLLGGHMVCGVHKGGVMFRVGKDSYGAALALPGTGPLEMGGRPMVGMIGADAGLVADDARRWQLMALALACVRALPPKLAKPAKTR